ncbi:MAG: hypothetical protein KMY55_00675, partial [Dethiosulfatibacter sp.]|nr:hypothetical protein [Dethiosulfatibacter sp.]
MGSLKSFSGVDLGVAAVNGALKKAGVDPKYVEEIAAGCIYKNGQKGNPARQVQLKTGMPTTGWAYTLDQQCASGMKAYLFLVVLVLPDFPFDRFCRYILLLSL